MKEWCDAPQLKGASKVIRPYAARAMPLRLPRTRGYHQGGRDKCEFEENKKDKERRGERRIVGLKA